MAKRKRLTPANPDFLRPDGSGAAPESTSAISAPRTRAPIADVAADSSASAALEEIAGEMNRARESGRLISRVALEQIDLNYLVRDRVAVNDEDMNALVASIRDRGQQTPIEVVVIGAGRYGLISGWRRCQAIARLREAGEGDGTVLTLQRPPEKAPDAYRAMVEENEIRADLSYFERARIVVVSVEQRVFDTHKKALQTLFAAASRSKRSKIGSFIPVVQHLGTYLQFPQAIGERLGLRLSRPLEQGHEGTLIKELDAHDFATSEDELACLTRWVAGVERDEKRASEPRKPQVKSPQPAPDESFPRPALRACYHPGDNRLELSGAGLTPELRSALIDWLAEQETGTA
ncbi:ParB N-terminal domain-containing protein [Phaeobacter sp. J2-8]|uniref:ParB/RepB/Spo0J family partition protein n=1 Tax=Phaeobacter sp. J2-8 TaxID=2931394 RepID=UPI001FD21EEA|nr:ParB N-terminal domain-containing protein [Phaeobacter sp. J2-8]MCJ7874816.1 ParB N-terminal domain-containing protein [Phaeobacter sp. J2-8]